MPHFYVDLKGVRRPEVFEYPEDNLQALCQAYNVKDPMHLDDHDSRIFPSEDRADRWLARYLQTLEALPKLKHKPAGVPCMLLKRRYLPQVVMGEKPSTWRSYLKPWQPGQIFAFHDQVHFVLVRLVRIEDTDKGYRYDYVPA